MLKITVGGRTVRPDNFADEMMKVVAQRVGDELAERIRAVRHPITGHFPTVVVRGEALSDMHFQVEASPELLALIRERFSSEDLTRMTLIEQSSGPRAFLSYAGEDTEQAEVLARALTANGIYTAYAPWDLKAGDSIRQKLDAALADCTHFVVLLTPKSINKPWVNEEMDAAFARKVESLCRFVPLRSGVSIAQLPPLLQGMRSLSLDSDSEIAIRQLVSDIHGITRRPPLGQPPAGAATASNDRYSAAAMAIAAVFVQESRDGRTHDPILKREILAERTKLSVEDVVDALHELRAFVIDHPHRVSPQASLFAKFDHYSREWNPADDALRLAADLVNDPAFPNTADAIAKQYDWSARRLNPALTYLIERGAIPEHKGLSSSFIALRVRKTDATRRFVKSRA